MKILILTSTNSRHDYFCLNIIKSFPDVSIIRQPKGSKLYTQNKAKYFLKSKYKFKLLVNFILNRLFGQANKKFQEEKINAENAFFLDSSEEFKEKYSHLIKAEVEPGKNINHPEYVNIIKQIQPDVIVVMGTSLIKDEIISIPKLGIINIHTGLSPYYRGGLTNFWPIVNKEPQYCGVTVHKLNVGIDSGDIIYNGLPKIEKDDNFSTINCKLIVLGTELMKKAISDLSNNNLTAKKQWVKGKLYGIKDINNYYLAKYLKLIKSGYINKFATMRAENKINFPDGLKLCLDENLPQHIPDKYKNDKKNN